MFNPQHSGETKTWLLKIVDIGSDYFVLLTEKAEKNASTDDETKVAEVVEVTTFQFQLKRSGTLNWKDVSTSRDITNIKHTFYNLTPGKTYSLRYKIQEEKSKIWYECVETGVLSCVHYIIDGDIN